MERPTRPSLHRNRTSESFYDEQLAREPRARQSSGEGGRQRSAAGRSTSPEGPLFACPYSKFDPDRYSHKNVEEHDYRNCSTGYWTSIPRLKQHLYRTHDRSARCCPRCWQNFANDESLRKHVDLGDCQYRPMPEEKMDFEKQQKVKERIQGRPVESWYTIYHILFPEDDPPPSPFAEWVTGDDLRTCFELLARNLPRLLFQAAIRQEQQAGNRAQNITLERNTRFPTTPNVIVQALLHCQKEFGAAKGMQHIFATGAPSFSGRGSGGSDASRARTVVSPVTGVQPRLGPSGYEQYGGQVPVTQPMQPNLPFTSAAYPPSTSAPMDADMAEILNLQRELYPNYSEDDWSQYS